MTQTEWLKRGGLKIPKSDLYNRATYNNYLLRLEELAINTFEWVNLPPEIDKRFLELTLFSTGMAVFYWEDIAEQFVALTTMIEGPLDIYQVPKKRRAYAVNGYNCPLTDKNSVLIFNNYLREPSFPTIEIYAEKLFKLQQAIDINLDQMKTPTLITCDENQRQTLKNLYQQYSGGEPVIFGSKNLDISGISVLKTDAPFLADKLQDQKQKVWNEALAYLGIETSNTEKSERLITDEVSANLGYTHAQRFTRLNMRRLACEQINKMFNLNVWVNFRSDISALTQTETTESVTETMLEEEVSESE